MNPHAIKNRIPESPEAGRFFDGGQQSGKVSKCSKVEKLIVLEHFSYTLQANGFRWLMASLLMANKKWKYQ